MSGIDRIQNAFAKNGAAFMPYAVLGYPTRQASLDIVQTLAETGADLMELGIPFSDPLADGCHSKIAREWHHAQRLSGHDS